VRRALPVDQHPAHATLHAWSVLSAGMGWHHPAEQTVDSVVRCCWAGRATEDPMVPSPPPAVQGGAAALHGARVCRVRAQPGGVPHPRVRGTPQALCGLGGPVPQAMLPVRTGRGQPGAEGGRVHDAVGPAGHAAHLRGGQGHRQGRPRDGVAAESDEVGRRCVWCARAPRRAERAAVPDGLRGPPLLRLACGSAAVHSPSAGCPTLCVRQAGHDSMARAPEAMSCQL